MEKIYNGNFGEIEKLVDENQIQEHPYSKLYQYIRRTNMETLRKNCIRRILATNSERIRYQLEKSFNRNCGENVDLSMQPYLIKPYTKIVKKYSNQIGQVKTLDSQTIFEEMVEKIYTDVMDRINESPKLVAEEIEKLYNKIMIECNESLNGIKYKGKYIVEEIENAEKEILYDKIIVECNESLNGMKCKGQYIVEEKENGEIKYKLINKDVVKELTDVISENDLRAFIMIELSEIKRLQLSKECAELCDDINNSKNIVYSYLLENVQKRLRKYEKKILKQLRDHKNKHLLKNMVSENIVEFKENEVKLNLTLERLAEIKIPVDLFEPLNIRCRLKLAEEYLISNIKKEYLEDVISGKKKINSLEKYFELPQFESMEPRNIKVILNEVHKNYVEEKGKEYNDKTTALAHLRNQSKTFKTSTITELLEDPDTNIVSLTTPTPQGMISRRNALYIIKTLIAMEENEKELNTFLNKENIAKLPNNEENYILNTTLDLLNSYVIEEEPKEKQKVKKIENKGEQYEK